MQLHLRPIKRQKQYFERKILEKMWPSPHGKGRTGALGNVRAHLRQHPGPPYCQTEQYKIKNGEEILKFQGKLGPQTVFREGLEGPVGYEQI